MHASELARDAGALMEVMSRIRDTGHPLLALELATVYVEPLMIVWVCISTPAIIAFAASLRFVKSYSLVQK